MIASAVINANTISEDRLTPFDFLPGYEPTPEELERKEIKRSIVAIFSHLPDNATAAEAQALKNRTLARLRAQGITDPEGLFEEIFPSMR